MKDVKQLITLLTFCLFVIFRVYGKDYYVNDASTTGDIYCTAIGNDANNGTTPATPKADVASILSSYVLTANDTVFIDAGTYVLNGQINITSAGSALGQIVFQGAGSGITIFQQPTNNRIINIQNSGAYLTFRGMQFINTSAGSNTADMFFSASTTTNIQLINCIFTNTVNNQNFCADMSGGNNLISHCTFNTESLGAIRFQNNSAGSIIENNTINLNNPGDANLNDYAIDLNAGNNITIENNKINGDANAHIGIWCENSTGSTIQNNYIAGFDKGIQTTSAAIGYTFDFNSIYARYYAGYFNTLSGWDVRDNIFETTLAGDVFYLNGTLPTTQNYNLYDAAGGGTLFYYNGASYTTIAALITAKGYEAKGISGNPLFDNPATGDLDLPGTSPAGGKGQSIAGITIDIYNTTRKNPPTIGAYEITAIIPLIVNAGNPQTACLNSAPLTLGGSPTASAGMGSYTYIWSQSSGAPDLSNTAVSNPTISPTATGSFTYTVSVSDGVSSSTANVSITINALPSAPIVSSNSPICMGNTLNFSCSASTKWNWAGPNSFSSTLQDPSKTNIQPVNGGVYSVTITDGNNCTNTAQSMVTVNPLPTVTAGGGAICIGSSMNITAGGANTYAWSNGLGVGSSIIVNPTIQTTYTVTGTDGNTCTNTAQAIVKINPLPIVTAGGETICTGLSAIVTAGGASSYTWSNGLGGGSSITINPTISTTYIVKGTDANTCTNTAQAIIAVNPLPTITAGGGTICTGLSVTLTAGGANTYAWSNGLGINSSITVNPTISMTYIVTGTDGKNCSNTAQAVVIVNTLPTVTANPATITVCSGQQVTFSGGGAAIYTWDNGITDKIPFIPSLGTTTFTVTGSDINNCSNTAQATITVNSLPTVTANPIDTIVCSGQTLTLFGGGANTYSWDHGINNNTAFTPSIGKTIYTVTGTDVNNCSNTAQATITVNPLPTVIAVPSDTTVCSGQQIMLYGNGATIYTWNNGITDNTSFLPSIGTTIYTVTGTDNNNCNNTAQATVTVNPLPTLTANPADTTICFGQPVSIYVTGAATYLWNNGSTGNITFIETVGTTIFTVTGTDSQNCSNTTQTTLIVNSLPTVTANPTDTTVCSGQQVTLYGNGAMFYVWDNGINNRIDSIFPSAGITVYKVAGIDSNNCINTAQATVTVTNIPDTPVIPSILVCFKEPKNAILSINDPNAAYQYNWFNTSEGTNIINQGTTFTVSNVLSVDTLYVEATEQGCTSPRGKGIITIGSLPEAIFTYAPKNVEVNMEVTFSNQSVSNTNFDVMQFTWSFGYEEGTSIQNDPTHIYKDTGIYIVQLAVINSDGCKDTLQDSIRVIWFLKPWIPSAFTPNGDINNDILYVRGPINALNFEVYNQWGFKVFETGDQSKGWDGKYQGIDQPEGNYTYVLSGTDVIGKEVSQKGIVTLIR